jgi:hypothetical protein
MKKLYTILFICFALQSFAQGNLQFNQVLTYTGTINSIQSVGTTYTVPINKVWKIKNLTEISNYVANNSIGLALYRGLMVNINNKWFPFPNNFKEMFLKAGDTIKMGYYDQYIQSSQITDPNSSINYLMSIVEFNIVP